MQNPVPKHDWASAGCVAGSTLRTDATMTEAASATKRHIVNIPSHCQKDSPSNERTGGYLDGCIFRPDSVRISVGSGAFPLRAGQQARGAGSTGPPHINATRMMDS